ncbi:MAG: hypothetical protein V3U45_00745 [bacterium]
MAPRAAAESKASALRYRPPGPIGWRTAIFGVLVALVSLALPPATLPADDELRRTPVVKAVERVGPAVVNISTEEVVPSGGPLFGPAKAILSCSSSNGAETGIM